MTARSSSTDNSRKTGPHYAHGTQRDSLPLPTGSIITPRAPLEHFDVPEPFRDIGLVLLGSFTTVSAVIALAIVLFVRVA